MTDYCIFIISYGRPKFLKDKTWRTLDRMQSKAKRIVVCSDDDSTIDEYKKLFPEVCVFSKDEVEKSIDLMDCYHGKNENKKGTVWARNYLYELARKLGYRYFISLDDDYICFYIRKVMQTKKGNYLLDNKIKLIDDWFDSVNQKMFDLLNSSPWLYTLGLAQSGDYAGAYTSGMATNGYRFKSMNVIYCDTEKPVEFYGRMNDDVTQYVLNGTRGMISLTLHGVQVKQLPTQQKEGGMTDIYKAMGTYVKSLYSIIASPSCVKLGILGKTGSQRYHHSINWNNAIPRILDEKYRKSEKDYVFDNKPVKKKNSFEKVELLENIAFTKKVEDFF